MSLFSKGESLACSEPRRVGFLRQSISVDPSYSPRPLPKIVSCNGNGTPEPVVETEHAGSDFKETVSTIATPQEFHLQVPAVFKGYNNSKIHQNH